MSIAREQLKTKIQSAYQKRLKDWRGMTVDELIEDCEAMYITEKLARLLPAFASEEDAAYLLRFVDPLEVVADAWIASNGLDAMIGDNLLDHLLWRLRDTGDAEADYELESAFDA